MPDQKRQHQSQNDKAAQANNQSASARNDASHAADAGMSKDDKQALAQLAAKVAEQQKQAASLHDSQKQELNERQALQKQEFEAASSVQVPEATESRQADRQAASDALNQFQRAQQDQLAERQQLEQGVLAEQARTVADLQARQRSELIELQQRESKRTPGSDRTFENERKQLDAKHQLETERLATNCREQSQALQDHAAAVRVQMPQDRVNLSKALDAGPGKDRQATLQDQLTKQEASRRELDQAVRKQLADLDRGKETNRQQGDAQMKRASENAILDQKFTKHKVILNLWQDAAKAARTKVDLSTPEGARKAYEETMRRFRTRLTKADDPQAQAARKIFEDAGFKFKEKDNGELKRNLPILTLDDKLEKEIDMGKHEDLLRISGQHMIKISDEEHNGPQHALDPDNLTFMIARDNMQMDIEEALAQEIRKLTVEEQNKRGLDQSGKEEL